MPKFFVLSDIHGFYDEMIEALNEAGFDENNENHWIITCGDYTDRGSEPLKVIRYLRSLPRKVLIKGNHETLLVECCERGEYYSHDISNGTAHTIWDIGFGYSEDFAEQCVYVLKRLKPFLNSMVNYFETKNYIFVHSWIPLINKDGLPAHYTRDRKFEFNPNWRNAKQKEWDDAMWGNPWDLAKKGLLPDKTIVFGHFHTSYPRHKYEGEPEWGDDADFSVYRGDGFIGIDGCTAYTRNVNVLVLDDEFLEDAQ